MRASPAALARFTTAAYLAHCEALSAGLVRCSAAGVTEPGVPESHLRLQVIPPLPHVHSQRHIPAMPIYHNSLIHLTLKLS